jgi:hypothetical protein
VHRNSYIAFAGRIGTHHIWQPWGPQPWGPQPWGPPAGSSSFYQPRPEAGAGLYFGWSECVPGCHHPVLTLLFVPARLRPGTTAVQCSAVQCTGDMSVLGQSWDMLLHMFHHILETKRVSNPKSDAENHTTVNKLVRWGWYPAAEGSLLT